MRSYRAAQFIVDLWVKEIRVGVPRSAALKGNDLQRGRRQLLGDDTARPSKAYDEDVDGVELGCHFNVSFLSRN
jgi:hypothetical protein